MAASAFMTLITVTAEAAIVAAAQPTLPPSREAGDSVCNRWALSAMASVAAVAG